MSLDGNNPYQPPAIVNAAPLEEANLEEANEKNLEGDRLIDQARWWLPSMQWSIALLMPIYGLSLAWEVVMGPQRAFPPVMQLFQILIGCALIIFFLVTSLVVIRHLHRHQRLTRHKPCRIPYPLLALAYITGPFGVIPVIFALNGIFRAVPIYRGRTFAQSLLAYGLLAINGVFISLFVVGAMNGEYAYSQAKKRSPYGSHYQYAKPEPAMHIKPELVRPVQRLNISYSLLAILVLQLLSWNLAKVLSEHEHLGDKDHA